MTDDPEGLASFDAGGVKYTAVFGFRAMKAVEAHYDKPFFHAIQQAMPQVRPEDAADPDAIMAASLNIRMTDVGVLLRCALLKHHPGLTEDEVDDLIDEIGIDKVGEIIGQAVSSSLVTGGDDGSPANPPSKNRKSKTG